MIISKCVPMQISRKRFSEFEKNHSPENMVFVGWKYDEEDSTKKVNVQLHYKHIKENIQKWIEENGGFGGGSENERPITEGTPTEATYFPIIKEDENGFEIVDENGKPIKNPDTWDEEGETNIVNLNEKKGFIEINGGGDYTEDSVFMASPYTGSITTIVVDNTGRIRRQGETEEEWKENRQPVEDFVLRYGFGTVDERPVVLIVPPYHRGVVQILHTEYNDLIINATYTDVLLDYIPDVMPTTDNVDNIPFEGEITKEVISDENKKVYVDMNDEHGFIEIDVAADGKEEYTFVFDNTELGSMTYIVIDNYSKNDGIIANNDVIVNYGKSLPDNKEDIENNICIVSKEEKAIIEVFHSLSTDIIVKITKI